MKEKWLWGEKRKLARAVGISDSYLGDILHGRQGAPPSLAKRLESEARNLGKTIHRIDWIYPNESTNPLFSLNKNI